MTQRAKDIGIYSGLSNEDAFKIMMGRMRCHEELPALRKWKAESHWQTGRLCALVTFALCYAGAMIAGLSIVAALTIGAGVFLLVVCCTWLDARTAVKKRAHMEALARALKEFEVAAASVPGANSAEILSAMESATSWRDSC